MVPRSMPIALVLATLALAACQPGQFGGPANEGEVSPLVGTLGGAGAGALAGRLVAGGHDNSAAILGGALIGGLGGLVGSSAYNASERQTKTNQQLATGVQANSAAIAQQQQVQNSLEAQHHYDQWNNGGVIPINTPGDVRTAQGLLAALGYYGGQVDGSYGPQTRQAVFRFQQSRGLPPTGDVTPQLVQQLRAAI